MTLEQKMMTVDRCEMTYLWVELLFGAGVTVRTVVPIVTLTRITPVVPVLHVGTRC